MKAYSEVGSGDAPEPGEVSLCSPVSNNNKASKGKQPQNYDNEQVNNVDKEVSLVQALHDIMSLTRLPAPEPSVFSGDPLKFIEELE